jgi:hypothetical protein
MTSSLPSSPARLCHAGNFTGKSELAETDPAQLKLADIATRPPAPLAAVPMADPQLWRLFGFGGGQPLVLRDFG